MGGSYNERWLTPLREGRYRLQLVMLGLSLLALVAVVMVLPITDASRAQLLGLLGILLSAAVALSSTTFLGSIMAGLTLRAVRAFRPGDFIRVGDHFGRVSELGLFHVEIQTEDRDLTTLPNLYLVTQPVTVVHSSGTIVSARLSLGYDVPRSRVEELLLNAAGQSDLEDAFVQILELGDFSLTCRVAGLYREVKHILSKRSELRGKVLDVLHEAGVEIVSPSFMNTRSIAEDKLFIPVTGSHAPAAHATATEPEAIVFDKAEHAQLLEDLAEQHRLMGEQISELEQRREGAEGSTEQRDLEVRLERLGARRERIERFLESERARERD